MLTPSGWFWVIFWCIVVTGCVADRYLAYDYDIEKQKIELKKLETNIKLEKQSMEVLTKEIKELQTQNNK